MDSDLQAIIGIDLDSWQHPVLQADSSTSAPELSGWGDSRPLAVLPWQRGLRPACDAESVASPWNCGLGWRQHASVGRNAARLPVWKLWDLLGEEAVLQDNGYLMGQATREHAYKDAEGADRQVHVRDLLQCFLAPFRDSMARRRVVMAVPNTLDEWAQEDVLAALGPQSRLLWRPIAAAMTWGAAQPAHLHKQYDGKHLAVCEARYDCVTVCKVRLKQVIRAGQSYLVPVRRLPQADNCAFQTILPLPFVLAEGLLDYHGIAASTDLVWQLTLGGEMMHAMLSGATSIGRRRACLLPTKSGWRQLQLASDDLPLIAGDATALQPGASAKEAAAMLGTEKYRNSRSWKSKVTDALKKMIRQMKPDGFLLHGEGCRVLIDDSSLGTIISRDLDQAFFPCRPMLRAIEAADGVPDHMVARGCVLLAQRSQLKQPTYFDQLRRLDIIVQDKNPDSSTYEDIIAKELIPDTEVEGDRLYQSEDLSGFAISRNEQHVNFYLRMQEEKHLRMLRQDFRVHVEQHEALVLRPTQEPARGHARIQVRNERLFTGGYVLLDWKRMERSKETLKTLNENAPRSCPPDMPDVESDPSLWYSFEPYVNRYLETPLLRGGKERSLEEVLDSYFFQRCGAVRFNLNSKNSLARQNAFGSSNSTGLPPNKLKAIDFLSKLQDDYAVARTSLNRLKLIRAIAWTYQGDTFLKLREHLVDKLKQDPWSLEQEELTACGQLFYSQSEFKTMIEAILAVLDDRGTDSVGWYINGLRKLVTYRPYALQHIEDLVIRRLFARICSLIEYELTDRTFGNRCKDALVALLFLLRRRRFDRNFLHYRQDAMRSAISTANRLDVVFPPSFCMTAPEDNMMLARTLVLLWRMREPLRKAAMQKTRVGYSRRAKHMRHFCTQIIHFLQRRGLVGTVKAFLS